MLAVNNFKSLKSNVRQVWVNGNTPYPQPKICKVNGLLGTIPSPLTSIIFDPAISQRVPICPIPEFAGASLVSGTTSKPKLAWQIFKFKDDSNYDNKNSHLKISRLFL